jgi:26S proteasome regulatory subunit N5
LFVVLTIQIFVEVERARVTRMLSDIKKTQGNLNEAADILCELQVETFGSMARREKTEFILRQVELCIERRDYTQAGILSRKIGTKFFARKPKKTPAQLEADRKARDEAEKKRSPDDPPIEKEDDVTDLKLKYYGQQITLAKQDDKYLEVCKHYRQVLDTESVEENPEQLRAALQRVVYFILLAPYDNEQNDLLHRIQQDSRVSQVPEEAALLKLFTVHELMRWPMVDEQFGPHLCSTDIFSQTKPVTGLPDSEEAKAFSNYTALRNRVIEHNVRVIAKYYTRITFPRLTALLDLSEEETEKYISDLVCKKTVYARIDRPARVVNFEMKRGPDEVLDEWSGSMKSLLGLLERVGHLMQKEEMMARIQPGTSEKNARSSVKVR